LSHCSTCDKYEPHKKAHKNIYREGL